MARADARYGHPCDCGDGFCAGCDSDPDNTDGLPVTAVAASAVEIGVAAALRGAHRPMPSECTLQATTEIVAITERFNGAATPMSEVRIYLTNPGPRALARLREELVLHFYPSLDPQVWIKRVGPVLCITCKPADACAVRDDVCRIIAETL